MALSLEIPWFDSKSNRKQIKWWVILLYFAWPIWPIGPGHLCAPSTQVVWRRKCSKRPCNWISWGPRKPLKPGQRGDMRAWDPRAATSSSGISVISQCWSTGWFEENGLSDIFSRTSPDAMDAPKPFQWIDHAGEMLAIDWIRPQMTCKGAVASNLGYRTVSRHVQTQCNIKTLVYKCKSLCYIILMRFRTQICMHMYVFWLLKTSIGSQDLNWLWVSPN